MYLGINRIILFRVQRLFKCLKDSYTEYSEIKQKTLPSNLFLKWQYNTGKCSSFNDGMGESHKST